jgi:hypothetical protein
MRRQAHKGDWAGKGVHLPSFVMRESLNLFPTGPTLSFHPPKRILEVGVGGGQDGFDCSSEAGGEGRSKDGEAAATGRRGGEGGHGIDPVSGSALL